MGKPTGKKKLQPVVEKGTKPTKPVSSDRTSKLVDEDNKLFIQLAQELREEGNKLFQKHDSEGAMLKYEKSIKLLPKNHIEVANLRSKMAICYMQLGLKQYPKAIDECNLALKVAPKFSKALVTRAKIYYVLNKFDLTLSDVKNVLMMEPNNVAALEIESSVKRMIEGDDLNNEDEAKMIIEKTKKKKKKDEDDDKEKVVAVDKTSVKDEKLVTKTAKMVLGDDKEKVVVVDKRSIKDDKLVTKTVKMILGDDIRWAELPVNCSIGLVREIIRDRFPGLTGVLIKYKDLEGDLITVLTNNELRLAENSSDPDGCFRLYLVETSPEKEPVYEGLTSQQLAKPDTLTSKVTENGNMEKPEGIEDWIVQFARVFKNHVGLDTNPHLDLHETGMELYSEAIEDDVINENSQSLFNIAGEKFKEMSALALFNWGNVHMNKARKLVNFEEHDSHESVEKKLKVGYEWAQKEYTKAGKRYEQSLKIKPDFYEGHLALGQQQFEHAKLMWHYTVGNKADVALQDCSIQILELYNKAEDNMEKGMQNLEELEERRLNGLSLFDKHRVELINMGLEGIIKDVPSDEVAEEAVNIKSQIYILWGTLLYERSVMEFKLGLSSWEECLEVAVEKFELAGVSETDISVIIKNHCSNGTALAGLNFKIDEIVQAWNEMFDTKRRLTGVPLFRLEPLFRRRVSKLHSLMEHL
ncbi:protein PHOX1-like [Bidens hawaiensis]|uniref:protein PHOX1-like n=1 Tax=Bidens hawaiensis TaxID=980011 RepID=UPI00404A14EA